MNVRRSGPQAAVDMIVDPLRHPDRDAAQLLADAHLAAQPGGLGEPEGQVQHIQLLVRRLVRQPVKVLLRQDDMEGGAGQSALARPEPVNVNIVVDDVERLSPSGAVTVTFSPSLSTYVTVTRSGGDEEKGL